MAVVIGIGYLAAAIACFIVWYLLRSATDSDPSAARTGAFWMAAGILLAVMGAGRALALSTVVADVGRRLARSEGWYDNRRPLQAAAALGATILLIAIVSAIVIGRRRRQELDVPMAIAMSALIAYAILRSVSLHAVDANLNDTRVLSLQLGDWLEVTLLLLAIGVATSRALQLRGRAKIVGNTSATG